VRPYAANICCCTSCVPAHLNQLMAKIQKSALELANLIRRRLAEPKLRIAVYPKVTGWQARVYAEEGAARDLQKRVDDVVQELNGTYDLAS
jgi:hypothetical protein